MDPRPHNRPTRPFGEQSPSEVPEARDEAARNALDDAGGADGEPRRRRSRYHAVRRRNQPRDDERTMADLDEPRIAGAEAPVRTSRDESGAHPIGPPEDAIPPEDAGKARPGHPTESPRGFARFVTIAALVILAIIVWVVLF
jgi:hypothetical protein